jgi:hypothetical protein
MRALPAPRQTDPAHRTNRRYRLQYRRTVPGRVPGCRGVLQAGVQPPSARAAEVRHGAVPDQDPGPQIPDQGRPGLPPLPCRPRHRAWPTAWPSGHRAPRWRAAAASSAVGRHLPGAGHHPSSPQRRPPRISSNRRSELAQRLLADACELYESRNQVEVHHIRALKDLNPKGGKHQPEWATRMAARHRKTLVVWRTCHEDIHAGRPARQPR